MKEKKKRVQIEEMIEIKVAIMARSTITQILRGLVQTIMINSSVPFVGGLTITS